MGQKVENIGGMSIETGVKPSADYVGDSRIVQSHWKRDAPGYTQPKLVVSDATLPRMGISMQKKLNISSDSFTRYWKSKNPTIWLNKRGKWPHATKSSGLRCYPSLMVICMQLIYSINDSFQRIWWWKNNAIWLVVRILGHNWKPTFSQTCGFLRFINNTVMYNF